MIASEAAIFFTHKIILNTQLKETRWLNWSNDKPQWWKLYRKKKEHLTEEGKDNKPWGTTCFLLGYCWMPVLWRIESITCYSYAKLKNSHSCIHVLLDNLWTNVSWLKPKQVGSLLHLYKKKKKNLQWAFFSSLLRY